MVCVRMKYLLRRRGKYRTVQNFAGASRRTALESATLKLDSTFGRMQGDGDVGRACFDRNARQADGIVSRL